MDTLLQNYKVQETKIILEVKKFEVGQKKKKFIYENEWFRLWPI